MNSSRVTIDNVAQRAGVSISTVSRVLNGRDRVHPATRERVLTAARALNYQPSAYARGLATQQTHTLGFVIPALADPFYMEIVRGVDEAANAAGYHILLVRQPHHENSRPYLQMLTQRRVDGMVLVGIQIQRDELRQIVENRFAVALVQQEAGDEIPTFLVDNYGGACALADHLIRCGHRRIAYITGSNYTPDNQNRLRGLRDTLAAHGLSLPPELVVEGDYMYHSGYEGMLRLLELPQKPDAVFAANDQMASGALTALQEKGLRVPEDIAVVGFDDVPLARYCVVPLTTVHQPTFELGFQAAQAVLTALNSGVPPSRTVLPTRLVIRRSCGCAIRQPD